jgi:hypothetical protein
VEGGLLLDVVVGQGAAILELLASEDKTLLVGGNALLVLDFGLHIVDSIRALHLKGDGLAREGLHEDLHGDGGAAAAGATTHDSTSEREPPTPLPCPLGFRS